MTDVPIITRTLSIGISGHRPHRLRVDTASISATVHSVLTALLKPLEESEQLHLISPLAEGADRIAAEAALSMGCRLTALLPFTQRTYEQTFDNRAGVADFRTLLARSHDRVFLDGNSADALGAYQAVGVATLDRSDILMTVWDGQPAAGPGGTAEIILEAVRRRIPVIWISATEQRQPRILRRARFGPAPRLDRIKQKASPASRLVLSGLGRAILSRR